MLLFEDVMKMPEEKQIEYLIKDFKISQLLDKVLDPFVDRFFNIDSFDMLDDKIEVLQALADGKPPGEIPKYYDVLEDYPHDYVDEDGAVCVTMWD